MAVIVKPGTRPLLVSLAEGVGGHGHATRERMGLEFKLSVSRELEGRGESSPLPNYSPDNFDEAARVLRELPHLELTLPKRAELCRSLIAEHSSELPASARAARFAFEGALVELFARHLNVSVATLLASMANTRTPPAEDLPVSRLVATDSLESCLTSARRAFTSGYRTLKLKLGPTTDARLLLAALRERYGHEVALRLDPNGSWSVPELGSLLDSLAPFAPELVEEPVPWRKLLELERSPLPLAMDESLIDEAALPALLERRNALNLRAVIVKPALHGLLRSLELAEHATAHGLDVIVTHLFDGPVGHATAASLALAVGSTHFAHGLGPHPGLLLDPTLRIRGLGRGHLRHTPEPGLPLSEIPRC